MSLAIWVTDFVHDDGEGTVCESEGFHQSLEGALASITDNMGYSYHTDNVAWIVDGDRWCWYHNPGQADLYFCISPVEVLP